MTWSWLFGKPKCPIEDESREWVEARMAWVMERFTPERIRNAKIILPTETFFPDAYDQSREAGELIFERVCTYVGVDRSRVRLKWTSTQSKLADGTSIVGNDGLISGASGTYRPGDWSRQETITIHTKNLAEPMQLVATAAHELCHVHLLGDGHVDHDEEDHEPLTDLLTVCLGLGIFGANACVSERSTRTAEGSGWSVGKLGYLHLPTWGYALAVFAWVRGEENPAWAKHLRPDARKVFQQASRYLEASGVTNRGLLE